MLFRTGEYISNLDYDESWYATSVKLNERDIDRQIKSERKGLNYPVYATTLLNT